MIRNEIPPIVPTIKSLEDTNYFPPMNDDHFFETVERATQEFDNEKFATFEPGYNSASLLL